MASQVGIWVVSADHPQRLERSSVALEIDLEDWSERDPAILSEGLRVVGRQLRVEAGYLDLLCLDVQGRWVVVELKRDRLHRDVVAQALDYAACIRDLPAEDLRSLIESGLDRLTNAGSVMESVESQLASEAGDPRDVAIMVAGAGVDLGLERVVGFMSNFDVPMSVVSFQVFTQPSGEQLLVREVLEDEGQHGPKVARATRSVAAISDLAARVGVGDGFDAIVSAAEQAGLFVRPYTRSVMITPPTAKNRFLMALTPERGKGLRVNHGPEAFAEFFEGVTAENVESILGSGGDHWYDGTGLDERVKLISEFLAELPAVEDHDDGRHADADTVMAIAALVQPGEWTTYGDLSTVAIGRSSAAMSIGTMASNLSQFPAPHRVLNTRGVVSPGWRADDGGGPDECRRRLEAEGIRFRDDGSADPDQRVSAETLQSRLADSVRGDGGTD